MMMMMNGWQFSRCHGIDSKDVNVALTTVNSSGYGAIANDPSLMVVLSPDSSLVSITSFDRADVLIAIPDYASVFTLALLLLLVNDKSAATVDLTI